MADIEQAVRVHKENTTFQCLSSEARPSGSNGATLHIIDTGEVYISHKGVWSLDLRLAAALKQSNDI